MGPPLLDPPPSSLLVEPLSGEDVLTGALSDVASTGVLASPVGVLVLASGVVALSRTGPPLSMGGLFGLLLLEHAASSARIQVKDPLFMLVILAPSIRYWSL